MDKLSYTYSKKTARLYYTTIPQLLESRAKETPDKPANIIRSLTSDSSKTLTRDVVTFADLADNSLKLASAFLAAGIKAKDRVAVIGPCCEEYLYLEYACQRLSVLLVRIPTVVATTDALVGILKKYKVCALVLEQGTTEERINNMLPGLLTREKSARVDKYGLEDLEHFLYLTSKSPRLRNDWKTITELCEKYPVNQDSVKEIQSKQDPDDPSVVLPTSGSTGIPKFIVCSHIAFIHWVTEVVPASQDSDDAGFLYMSDRPPSWGFGMTMLPSFLGCTMINLDPDVSRLQDNMKSYTNVVIEEKVTATFALNYALYDMLVASRDGELTLPPTLQNVNTGGERTPEDVFEFAKSAFKNLTLMYGASEVGGLAYRRLDESSSNISYEEFNWMLPGPSTQFKVTNEEGKLLPCGEVGDISVKTCSTFIGYLDDELATKEVLSPSGWFKTGDLGIIREDGMIKVVGRTKDVISKGGVMIYPLQAEVIVAKHPAVLKVVVIAVPDPRLFNEVCACVIPKPGEQVTESELREFCESQSVTERALALPKYYLILEQFPTVSTGKVDKRALRAMAVSRFNLTENSYCSQRL